MGMRRDRPAQETAAGSIGLRLRDGSRVSVSLEGLRAQPVEDAVCCFCGEAVERSDPRHVTVAVRRSAEGKGEQAWSAHDTCLAERLHARAKETGHFPDP